MKNNNSENQDVLSELTVPNSSKPIDLGFDPYFKVELTERELREEMKALTRDRTKDRDYRDFNGL